MPDDTTAPVERIEEAFREAHGYNGFALQYAALSAAEKLAEQQESRWLLEASEVPFDLRGKAGHIDFVLRLQNYSVVLVVECKRQYHKLFRVALTRAPFGNRSDNSGRQFDAIVQSKEGKGGVLLKLHTTASGEPNYHVAVVLVNRLAKKEPKGEKGSTAVSNAEAQVLRGASFTADFYVDHLRRLIERSEAAAAQMADTVVVVPVILTTAPLFVSDDGLNGVDLTTGVLPENGGDDLRKVDWAWYTVNRSEALGPMEPRYRSRAAGSGFGFPDSLSTFSQNSARSIAVVTTTGWENFLSKFSSYSVGLG